jgi:DNA gyrase subunit A
MPLKKMLRHFVDFRREVVVRRTAFDLRKAEERAHILEGLKLAIDNLDEVVQLIRQSKTPQDAREALRLRFKFSEIQAQAILEMRLQRLTGLERQKIVEEFEETLKQIARFQQILGSEALQLQIVIEEMEEIRQQFGNRRRTEIVPATEEITLEDLIEEEDMVITVSTTGYIKRTSLSTYESQHRGGKGRIGMRTREEDAVRHLFVASTHDYILVFTTAGKLHWLKVHEIPEVGSAGRGKPVVNLIQIRSSEKVAAMLSVRDFPEDRHVVLATRRGYIKKTALSGFSRPRAGGIIAQALDDGDQLFAAGLSSGGDEIFMASRNGKSIRFNEQDVRPMGRSARGVIGIRLAEGDSVVAMEVLDGKPEMLTITSNGYGKRTSVGEYRLQNRGGSGIINIRTTKRNGEVAACMEVAEGDEILVITANGKIIRMSVDGISRIGRATQGVRVIQTDEGDNVVSAIRTADTSPEQGPSSEEESQ